MNHPHQVLKIAFIGAGGIVKDAHLTAIELYPDCFDVLGISDPHFPSARKQAERCGPETQAFESMEALYDAIGDQLDAVVVATPHFLHEPSGRYFLERGIPVLMEKPVACNLRELEALMALEKDKAFIQVAQQQRFEPEARWLKDFIHSGERFGEPLSFDLNIWQNIEGYVAGRYDHWILDGEKAGGGICISVGCHPLDLIRFITGQDFTEVTAIGRFDPPFKNGAESSCSALFRMSGGLSGTLHASYKPTRIPYSQRLVLFGERGSLYQDAKTGQYAGAYTAVSADPKIPGWFDMYGGFEPIAEQVKASYPNAINNPYASQLLSFRESVFSGGKPEENSLEINYNTIAVLDAIAASMQSGKTETVRQLR